MRNNSWVALAIVFAILVIALISSGLTGGVSFTTIDAPDGTDPEATAGDTLVFEAGSNMTITGDATTDTITFTSAITGSSANSFETMATTSGTSPVADSATDTLNLTAGDGVTVTGNSGTDVIVFDIAEDSIEEVDLHAVDSPVDEECLTYETTIGDFEWQGCGTSVSFDTVTTGTNSTATMTVDTGASILVESNAILQSNESVFSFWNDTGGTLFQCTAVYISGFDIPSDLPEAAISDSDAGTTPAIGLVTADVADGTEGKVIVAGAFTGIDTDTGEGWTPGDVLYLNDSGTSADDDCGNTLSMTRPANTDDSIQPMAVVGRAHATQGELIVIGSSKQNSLPNLPDDNVWVGEPDDTLPVETTLPDCDDSGGNHLNYDTSTNAFSCGSTGGAATNSFETMDTPAGTDPVADSPTDTLTWSSVNATIAIAGSATTDNIDLDAIGMNCTGCITSLNVSDDSFNVADIFYGNTLAGNPGLLADECYFTKDGGVGGGFICEGSTTNANEQLYLFPDVDGADTTDRIVVNSSEVTSVDGRSLTVGSGTLDADAELYTDTHTLWLEAPTAADDLQTIWTAVTNSYTITAITCESDQTVNFDLQIDDGTPTGVNGSDIACTTYATDSSLAGDTGLDAGERLDLAITSVSGSPTWVSISWTVTKND